MNEETTTEGHEDPPGPAALRRARRILVVDDNQDAADSLTLVLKHLGYQVRQAYDALSALDIAKHFEPQVVLLDIRLPDMDGYALAGELRRQKATAQAVLIAVSGYGQDEDRARSASAGIDHHLVKPVEIERLQRLLEEVGAKAAE
jgi:CheY-like chemotaxis protein